PKMIEGLLEHENVRMGGTRGVDATAMKRFEHAVSETRRRGLARVVGTPIPGVNAVSAPIFDSGGNIVLAMTAMGPTGTLDPAWLGEFATAVRDCANAVSARLGYAQAAPAVERTGTKGR